MSTPADVTPLEPYWMVIVNESSGHISVEPFDNRSDLVGRLRSLVQRGGYRVFVFQGRRLQISKPPHRFLLDRQDQIPLFEIKMSAEEDDSGNLDDRIEDGQDEVYRAITRKGLDEVAVAQVEALPPPPPPTSAPVVVTDDDDD